LGVSRAVESDVIVREKQEFASIEALNARSAEASMKNTLIWLSVISLLGTTALGSQPARAADLYADGCANNAALDFKALKGFSG